VTNEALRSTSGSLAIFTAIRRAYGSLLAVGGRRRQPVSDAQTRVFEYARIVRLPFSIE
jgi:hypothetical protein